MLCPAVLAARGDDKQAFPEASAIESAVQAAIAKAEPSVACISISRSDVYRKLLHDTPPPDNPGQLGGFDPSRVHSSAASDETARRYEKYDLALPQNVPEGSGSGVVLDAKRLLVLTNYHIVRDATKIYVSFAGGRGSYANIHAADPRSDLAVLRLVDEKLAPLSEMKFGDGSGVRKGQFVIALTNPFAAGFRDVGPRASWGIISNIHQRAAANQEERDQRALHSYRTLIQTDMRMSSTSGGALLNLQGEMIGLATSRVALSGSETAGGFAIPMDATAKRIIGQLREGEEVEYGFLGVRTDPRSRPEEGLQISDVVRGSPAYKARLQPGEWILSINNARVADPDDLFLAVAALSAGSDVRLEIRGRSQPVPVKLAKLYIPGKIIVSKKCPARLGCRVDYTSVLWLQNDLPDRTPFARAGILPGVYVSEVQSGSRAALSRLQVNDIISHVDGRKVDSPAEFYKEMERIGSSAPVELTLQTLDWHGTSSSKLRIN
jgi:serine protease Do